MAGNVRWILSFFIKMSNMATDSSDSIAFTLPVLWPPRSFDYWSGQIHQLTLLGFQSVKWTFMLCLFYCDLVCYAFKSSNEGSEGPDLLNKNIPADEIPTYFEELKEQNRICHWLEMTKRKDKVYSSKLYSSCHPLEPTYCNGAQQSLTSLISCLCFC